MLLQETTRIGMLYDFYSPLLTERQRTILKLYYFEDWSLGEIADHTKVSRQAVFEAVKRARSTLDELEGKLHLLEKHQQRRKLVQQIRAAISTFPEKEKAVYLLEELLNLD